jgi:hypothetical protein
MNSEKTVILDGVEINDTAEFEESSGVWLPVPPLYFGLDFTGGFMKPVRQRKFKLPEGSINLNISRRITAIANEEVTYTVNEAEYLHALCASELKFGTRY